MSSDWNVICDYSYKFIDTENKNVSKEEDKVIFYTDGTKYHKDNKLNNLTSKAWLIFQKSWFILRPKSRKENVKLHPAKYPEDLVLDFVQFFTKLGDTVRDPMLGTGSTLVTCAECGRSGIGIELQEKYAEIAKERINNIVSQSKLSFGDGLETQFKIIRGNSKKILDMELPQIDYIITSPPYWDMLKEKGFETQKQREDDGLDVYYSDDDEDVGNIEDYEKIVEELVEIYRAAVDLLKPKGYMTIVVKNIKKGGTIYPLAWDLARRLNEFIKLKDEKIWCQDDVNLAPYGYKNAWVSNTSHQYCLNFRKEESNI